MIKLYMSPKEKHTIEDVRTLAGDSLTDRLLDVIKEKAVVDWFYLPNKEFDGKSPYELCQSKDIEPIERMCYMFESGQPG